jgi:hypothetical protein
MNKMNYKAINISISICLFLTSIVFASNSELVGVWVDSKHNYYEFKADGTFDGFDMAENKKYVGVSGTYKIEDNKIIITFTKSENCKLHVGETNI